jgi:hypothetical protein
MKRIIALSLTLSLAAAPALRADVIPAAGPAPAAPRAELAKTLQERGLAAAEARMLAERVGPEDAAWFAQDPQRVQAVGGLLFEEWAGAALAAVGIPLAVYVLLRGSDIYGD